jgi:hypothetical protein
MRTADVHERPAMVIRIGLKSPQTVHKGPLSIGNGSASW